jgi:tRNA pseudouridine38-40 synthase
MSVARVYRITLEYDGREFAGWQRQAQGERTVQGCLEASLSELVGETVLAMGSGRTDAGVHALGQVASARFATQLDPPTLQRALNARLPRDIAALSVALAPPGFDARRWATGKLYRYSIWNGRERSPLRAARFHFVPMPLDLPAMRQAAAALVGEHDFAAFQAVGSNVASSIRRLDRLELAGESGGEIQLEAAASGFLRHMVRNLAGTLIEVGQGRRRADSLRSLLASRDRSRAGPTAPPQGLALVRVVYPAELLHPPELGLSDDFALESGA